MHLMKAFLLVTALLIANKFLPAQKLPNIVLIVADDMGMQMSGLHTPGVKTPVLDSLVKSGTVFTRAYAAFPSCSPSRVSILSGTFPHVHGVTTNVHETLEKASNPPQAKPSALNTQFAVKNTITTLVESLRNAGYFTGLTGKFHISSPEKFPFDYWGRDVQPDDFFKQAKATNKPFFLDYNLHSPHRPYAKSPNDRSKTEANYLEVPPFLPNNALMQKDWSDYLGAVEATDKSVGDLLAKLKNEGLDKNTLIVFISDHGLSTHRGKYDPYAFGSHVPVVFAGPQIRKNAKSNTLISLIDLMPTILHYINQPIPASINGRPFNTVLLNGDSAINQYIVTEVSFPRKGENNYQARAMSDGRYWYIRRNGKPRLKGKPEDNYEIAKWGNYSYQATVEGKDDFPLQYQLMLDNENATGEQLFDLYSDPWCMQDISSNNTYKKVLDRKRGDMDNWIKSTGDKEMMMTVKSK